MDNAMHQARHDSGAYRRIEVITGKIRRRRWSTEEKARIITESFEEGVNISEVARRNGINRRLLNVWRREASSLLKQSASPAFAPVVVDEGDISQPEDLLAGTTIEDHKQAAGARNAIEIEISGAIIRVPAGADIKTLAAVIGALRRPA